jgi:hypothetical protein
MRRIYICGGVIGDRAMTIPIIGHIVMAIMVMAIILIGDLILAIIEATADTMVATELVIDYLEALSTQRFLWHRDKLRIQG